MIRMLFYIVLLLMHLSQIWGEEIPSANRASNVLAQVIDVKTRDDNKWMVAVKDSQTASRWDVEIKQSIPKDETMSGIFVHFYTRDTPNSFQVDFFESNLCLLLTDYSNSQFFPKDIVNMILPGHQGSCKLKKGTHSIKSTACVNTNTQQNQGLIFPVSKPYELIVDFLSKQLPDDQRFFRVKLLVGSMTGCTYEENNDNGENGQYENKCLSTSWIVKALCNVHQTITSAVVRPLYNLYRTVTSAIAPIF